MLKWEPVADKEGEEKAQYKKRTFHIFPKGPGCSMLAFDGDKTLPLGGGSIWKTAQDIKDFLEEYLEAKEGLNTPDETGETKVGHFDHTSQDGRIRVYETFHDFQVELLSTGECKGMGDGVDMFSNAAGHSLPVQSPEFYEALENSAEDSSGLIAAYFSDSKEEEA